MMNWDLHNTVHFVGVVHVSNGPFLVALQISFAGEYDYGKREGRLFCMESRTTALPKK